MTNRPGFDLRADETPPWAKIRVSLRTVEWLAGQWATTATHALMTWVWGSFRSSEAHFRAQLPSIGKDRLAAISSRELVKYLQVAAAVDQGSALFSSKAPPSELPSR